MKNKYLVLLFFVLCPSLFAQNKDFGLWTSIGMGKKLEKWDFGINTELRTDDNSSQIHRWSLELKASYNILKPLKAGISYKYIHFHDIEYSDYQPRQRYTIFIQGKQNVGNFKFYLREKYQRTIKDERDRIQESGNYDNYKINPVWVWRNRFKVAYNIPKCRITPSLSFESFYQLNNPEGNTFNNLRYTLLFQYKLNKHHKFKFYGLINKEINTEDPVKTYVSGLEYIYTF